MQVKGAAPSADQESSRSPYGRGTSPLAASLAGLVLKPFAGWAAPAAIAGRTLAMFEALVDEDIERDHAVELVGDACWEVYAQWGQIPKLASWIRSGDRVLARLWGGHLERHGSLPGGAPCCDFRFKADVEPPSPPVRSS